MILPTSVGVLTGKPRYICIILPEQIGIIFRMVFICLLIFPSIVPGAIVGIMSSYVYVYSFFIIYAECILFPGNTVDRRRIEYQDGICKILLSICRRNPQLASFIG